MVQFIANIFSNESLNMSGKSWEMDLVTIFRLVFYKLSVIKNGWIPLLNDLNKRMPLYQINYSFIVWLRPKSANYCKPIFSIFGKVQLKIRNWLSKTNELLKSTFKFELSVYLNSETTLAKSVNFYVFINSGTLWYDFHSIVFSKMISNLVFWDYLLI